RVRPTDRVLGPAEPSPRHRRGLLVEQYAVGLALLGCRPLHLRDPLRRQLVRVLLLDPRQPTGTLLGIAGVDLDRTAVERAIDLLEERGCELSLRQLPQRLAVGEDESLVLGAGDTEVGMGRLPDAVDRAAQDRDLD